MLSSDKIIYKTNVELTYTRGCIFIAHDPGRIINLLRSVLCALCHSGHFTVVEITS